MQNEKGGRSAMVIMQQNCPISSGGGSTMVLPFDGKMGGHFEPDHDIGFLSLTPWLHDASKEGAS